MTGVVPLGVGQWLPPDRQALRQWLDDLVATFEARGHTPLLPVIDDFFFIF